MEENESKLTSMQIICFKIGKEEYGIDILNVQEILKITEITKLPKSAKYIIGVIDLRGRVIPIVDLSIRFGSDESLSIKSKRAIVIDIKGKKIGLAIDAVSNVARVDSKNIEPPPPIIKGISGKYISGVAKLDRGFIIVLDVNQIFSSEELKVL